MISQEEYKARRKQLMAQIRPDSLVVIPSAKEYLRNGDSDFRFRQNSDFYYLTGFNEPEAVLILAPGCKEGEYILFCRERDLKKEIWVGKFAGQDGARQLHGADQAFSSDVLDEKILELLLNRHTLYYPVGNDLVFDQRLLQWVNKIRARVRVGVNAPTELVNVGQILHEMRLRKSGAEIDLMRKAAQISAQAHCRAIKACRPGMMEYELEAELTYEFIKHGCQSPAYSSIVGAGVNACVLHYTDNNRQMKSGELVLIDAAAECDCYAADITRTFPVNGRFTSEQRAIYELVLRAQLAVIELIKPGASWPTLQQCAVRIITEGLVELGLLSGNVETLIEQRAYDFFYMHNIGHWLGLDVHDVGRYKVADQWRQLEPGIVLTVEPGIYIRVDEKVDKKWWNIGVRIEDDVLVTQTGHEVLTRDVPKTIAELEQLMQHKIRA